MKNGLKEEEQELTLQLGSTDWLTAHCHMEV